MNKREIAQIKSEQRYWHTVTNALGKGWSVIGWAGKQISTLTTPSGRTHECTGEMAEAIINLMRRGLTKF